MGKLNNIYDFFTSIDIGIFMKRSKKQKLLRKKKMVMLELLETNKKILKLIGENETLESEIKELENKLYD